MKCVLKTKANKAKCLELTEMSIEQKQRNEHTYLWYESIRFAREDARALSDAGIQVQLLKGWDVEGFISLR